MDPNSRHQQWSDWIFTIDVYGPRKPRPSEVKLNFGKLARSIFGSAGRMLVMAEGVPKPSPHVRWTIRIQVDTESVHDPLWRNTVRAKFAQAAEQGFGKQIAVSMHVDLLAGENADGRPPDQWIALPMLEVATHVFTPGPGEPHGVGLPHTPSTTKVFA